MSRVTIKSSPRRKSSPRKSANIRLNMTIDISDIVRVAGFKNAQNMVNRVLRFVGNNKTRVNVPKSLRKSVKVA